MNEEMIKSILFFLIYQTKSINPHNSDHKIHKDEVATLPHTMQNDYTPHPTHTHTHQIIFVKDSSS